MGMTEEFEASLQVLRGFDTAISIEVKEIKRSVASTSRRATIKFRRSQTKKILVSPNGSAHGFKVGIGLLCLQQLSGANGVLFYSSTIFASAGISSSNVATCGLGAIQCKLPIEEQIHSPPNRVHADQWKELVKYWHEDAKKVSDKNKSSRARQIIIYRMGKTPLAVIRVAEAKKLGHDPSRAHVFVTCFTKKGVVSNKELGKNVVIKDDDGCFVE